MNGIILYGDSVFFGYGVSDKSRGCGRVLKRKINTPILIKAKNNITSRDAIANARAIFSNYPDYSRVVIMFGNNDCRLYSDDTSLVTKSEYENNLRQLINMAKQDNKKCYLCNLQPINNKKFMLSGTDMIRYMKKITDAYLLHKSYSDICVKVAKETSIPLMDIRKPLEDSKKDIFYADGLHPNDIGHEIIAQVLYKELSL